MLKNIVFNENFNEKLSYYKSSFIEILLRKLVHIINRLEKLINNNLIY